MIIHCLSFLLLSDSSRISGACLPIPLPDRAAHPLPPDRLRAESPWTLSLAGDWRFRLTHGEIVDGRFTLSHADLAGLSVSSTQSGHAAANAFDGNPDTRWCATSGDFPQWMQARLDDARVVTGLEVAWERPEARYTCRVEGGNDGVHWKTLLDKPEGVGDGLLELPSTTPVHFVRLVILGATGGSWASIRELKIHYRNGEKDTVWQPAPVVSATPAHADDFVAPAFADTAWNHVTVPSNWEMAGYSIPTYNSVDDTVGLYRRWVDVPAAWADRRIVWRFDGALDGAEIYVNGLRAGYHESGYTAFDVDLTGLLVPGQRNLLAVRLSKTTPSVECETGDYQCMGGIYRDTRLIAVPKTHIADLTVRTPLSSGYRDATVLVNAKVSGAPGDAVGLSGYVTDALTLKRLPVALTQQATIGPDGTATVDLSAAVETPKLWSAEKPSLYYLTLELRKGGKTVEQVEQRFGFRQVEIKNSVVLWNGKPIKCTGICRHDFWPDKGFALTDAQWTKDLTLMKATNINAIRTSHYNHAARFLELCDERGFYILDEVPFCWVDDRVSDPSFAPPLLQRAAETIARDKNRPCVLAWSLGNENPIGIDTQQVHDLVARLDPTRPSFASGGGPNNVKGQELFDTHYPSPGGIEGYLKRESNVAPEVITEHPHTFYSRETQTYDPGASDTWSEGMIATWDLMRRSPTLLGSFIWEWQSQGIADHFPDHTTDFYFGTDHMRQENNKGIMDAFRKPKAEQWIVKMVYSPVQISSRTFSLSGGACVVPVTNLYSFTDLSELSFHWTAYRGDSVIGQGKTKVDGAPGQTVEAKFDAPAGLTSLRLEVNRQDGSSVTVVRLSAPGAAPVVPPLGLTERSALAVHEGTDKLEIGSANQQVAFDKRTGNLQRWVVAGHDRLRDGGPFLNLGEAATAKGDRYYRAKQAPITEGASVTAETIPDGSIKVVCRAMVRPSAGSTEALGTLTTEYTIRPSAEIAIHWRLDWTANDQNLWEIGLCMPVPSGLNRQAWSRDSYFTAYPDGHIGAPQGVCGPQDVAFRSSKRALHFLTLTDKDGSGLALIADKDPLIGRAHADRSGVTLFASREVAAAGPDDLSQSWFHAHDIYATHGKPLSGGFILRAIGGK